MNLNKIPFIYNFSTKYPQLYKQKLSDTKSTFRIFAKTFFIIQIYTFLDTRFDLRSGNSGTPTSLNRVDKSHMTLPPIIKPHPDLIDKVEEYENLTDRLFFDACYNTQKLKYTMRDHPKRESDYIIDEFLWESETSKLLDEMRFAAKKEMISKGVTLPNNYHQLFRKKMFSQLNEQVIPQIN